MGCLHGVHEKQPAVTTDGGNTALLSRLREAIRDRVGVPLLDVVVRCLAHLLFEVELVAWDRRCSLPGLARPKARRCTRWRSPGVAGSRHPPHRLPGLRSRSHRTGAVGGPERPAHRRLREHRGLAGAADGQDQHRPAAALLLGSCLRRPCGGQGNGAGRRGSTAGQSTSEATFRRISSSRHAEV
jgi:hypothetical protein